MIDASKYTAHKHPGKFEGQTAATEYYWEQMLEGDGETLYPDYPEEDYDCPIATVFHVNAEEAAVFGLTIGATFMICDDSQGFVCGSEHKSRDEAEASLELGWDCSTYTDER